ncbi:MAG: hypothetical protein K6E62_02770, partial [Lachnospiraceae bacterium]|nr:hypothetical protein [Lachnospiraceae bacterium]
MNKKKNCFALKQAGIVILACLICIWGLSGCRKNSGPETGSRTAQETTAPTLEQESTLTPIKIPTPTPTPIPALWESYERIGERSVFKVPVKELEDGVQIAGSSAAGGYVLLQIMDRKTDIVGPEWAPIILLRPAESGKAVSYTPVFPVRSVNVLADGTVFLEDAGNGAIHVFDRFFNETGSIVSEEDTAPILMAVTDDGHLWRFDYDTKRLSICDRNGENLKYFENDAGRRIFQDLGGKDGKRYFLAMDSDEYNSDVILYADADTGVVTEQDEHILNVTIAEYPSFFPNSGGILYDISNETWYLHLISDSGRRIALPRHYQ